MTIRRTVSRTVFALGLAICGLTPVANAQLAVCDPMDLGFGVCFSNQVPHAGDLPYAATGIPGTTSLVVCDLYSGFFYEYDAANISTTAPIIRPAPLGPAEYTGVAASATNLFFIVRTFGSTGQMLVQTGLDGSAPTMNPVASPLGGQIVDITFSTTSNRLWALDADNDRVFELNTDGTVAPGAFTIAGASGSTSNFGVSLTTANDITTGTEVLDIPFGLPADNGVSRTVRYATSGTEFGRSYAPVPSPGVAALFELDFLAGIAWVDLTDAGAEPSHFYVDSIANVISQIPLVEDVAREVTDLSVVALQNDTVSLSWTNSELYDEIRVERFGPANATFLLSGTDTTFIDLGPAEGLNRYVVSVRPVGSLDFTASVSARTVVGQGRRIATAELATANPFAIAIAEVPGGEAIYVADLDSGDIERLNLDLTPSALGTLTNPLGAVSVAGIAWNDDTDRLLWLFELSLSPPTYQLVETDFDGTMASAPIAFTSPSGGVLGDITYSASNTYWGVDTSFDEYFSFDAAGVLSGTTLAGVDPAGVGTSIAADSVALYLPTGTSGSQAVNQVSTFDTMLDPLGTFPIGPSVPSSFVSGVAVTDMGSTGAPSLYAIGNETRSITEVSSVAVGAPFLRGDVNDDGTRNIVDALAAIDVIFQGAESDCADTADSDDSGTLEVGDIVGLLGFLVGGAPISAPATVCEVDPTVDLLNCDSFSNCP